MANQNAPHPSSADADDTLSREGRGNALRVLAASRDGSTPHPSSADADDTLSRKGRGGTRFARSQRAAATQAENILWRELRNRRFEGLKFRRQVPVGPYVVDFLCYEARLIVELDGPPHDNPIQRENDARRDEWLRLQSFRILRFKNDLLLGGAGQLVVDQIQQTAREGR